MLSRYLFLLFAATILILACGSNDTTNTRMVENMPVGDSSLQSDFTDTLSGCYQMIKNKDSAFLLLDVKDKKVTGSLTYSIYEKDSNKGSIAGKVEDSLIKAWYTFQSEGVTSVREMVFKIEAGHLLEGMAQIAMQNDTAIFAKNAILTYAMDRPFDKISCK